MKNILKMIGLILLYFITYLLSSFFVGIFLGIYLVIKNISSINMGNGEFISGIQSQTSQYTNIILIATSILALILFWVIFIVRKKSLFRECNFSKISLRNIGLLIIGGISLCFFINSMLSYIIEISLLQKYLPGYNKISQSLLGGNVILTMLSVCIVAPIFEEIFFRSIIFNELRKNMPLALAIILQAAIFGAFHLNIIQGSYAFILGIIFSLVYNWTKSLWAPIIMHMIFNSTSFILSRIPHKQLFEKFGVLFLAAGFIVCAVALLFVYKNTKGINNTETEEISSM